MSTSPSPAAVPDDPRPPGTAAASAPESAVTSAPSHRGTSTPPPGPVIATASAREYGLWAVIAGLVVLAVLDGVTLALFHRNINSAVGVIGALSSPIVAMVSAYFGIKVGAQSGTAHTAASEQARKNSETQSMAFLGQMTPDQAKPILKKLGVPVAD